MTTLHKGGNFSSADVPKPLIVADPQKGIKMDVGVVAQPFRDEIRAKVAAMKNLGLGEFKIRSRRRLVLCPFLQIVKTHN
jgi:hypothetical protein